MQPGDRQLNRHVDVLEAYDEVLTIRSDQAGAWLGRADACYQLKRFDEALAAYNKTLAINRDLAEARHGLGVVNWCAARGCGRTDSTTGENDNADRYRN